MMALGDFGGSMCEARFALQASQSQGRSRHRHVPAGTTYLAFRRELDVGYQARCIAVPSDDQLNSVPSIHIRCRITASFRATATRALLRLLRFAMRMPQALRADHFPTRVNSTLAASYR